MIGRTSGPCVCVQSLRENCGGRTGRERKPQEGGLCEFSYTAVANIFAVLLLCVGAKLHTQTHTERPVCVQSVGTTLEVDYAQS
jgi:hypothetical protein